MLHCITATLESLQCILTVPHIPMEFKKNKQKHRKQNLQLCSAESGKMGLTLFGAFVIEIL